MTRSILSISAIATALAVLAATGCDQSDSTISPAVLAAHQTRLVLAEEPDGVQTVLDVREALLGESVEIHDHDHAEHGQEENADHDLDGDEHSGEEHAGHDHDDDEHPDEDHAGHDLDDEDHAGHDHDGDDHAEEEHAGHDEDDDEHSGEEHAGHDEDDDEHSDEEHAGHDDDGDNHAEEEHAEHEHEDEDAHEHEEIAEVEPTGPIDVLMVGTIGGLSNPWEETQPDFPFAKNQASFFLADPGAVAEQEASGHVHAPGEECSFCAAHAADVSAMLAMVRFLDENGKILPIGVPRMFDVKAMDTVVIQGTARIVAGGMLVVDATGIYVRR